MSDNYYLSMPTANKEALALALETGNSKRLPPHLHSIYHDIMISGGQMPEPLKPERWLPECYVPAFKERCRYERSAMH